MPTDGIANTNIVWHGGKLLALEEGHAPFEMDPNTLESIGAWTFDGKLVGPMTAHPKMDPETGEMVFFGYNATGVDLAGHVVPRRRPQRQADAIGDVSPRRMRRWCTTSW